MASTHCPLVKTHTHGSLHRDSHFRPAASSRMTFVAVADRPLRWCQVMPVEAPLQRRFAAKTTSPAMIVSMQRAFRISGSGTRMISRSKTEKSAILPAAIVPRSFS